MLVICLISDSIDATTHDLETELKENIITFNMHNKMNKCYNFSSVQSLSDVRLFVTPWTAALPDSLSPINSRSLLKLMSIESVKHPTISSSVVPFFSCLQSFPSSGPFPMSPFFASGGQSIAVSASTSVLPMNIQD